MNTELQSQFVKGSNITVVDPKLVDKVLAYVHELNRAIRVVNGQDAGSPLENMKEFEPAKYAGVRKAVEDGLYRDLGLSPGMQHEKWVYSKLKDGWTYGPKEDREKKTHPCMAPFHELPFEERLKDVIFTVVIEFFRTIRREQPAESRMKTLQEFHPEA